MRRRIGRAGLGRPPQLSVAAGSCETGFAMSTVFLSYSSKNTGIADQICAALEAAGISTWIAHRDGRAGVNYGEFIIDAINASKLMVLVFSTDANESEQGLAEIERARSKRNPVIT